MSHEMHHFDLGLWVLFLAYGTSIAGSFVGLSCARRAATTPLGPTRWRWLVMAALSISGVGIWMTHFIAMMGFAVPGTIIRYDPMLTILSAVIAIGATLFGLWLVDLRALAGRPILDRSALLIGGAVMGVAVSLMHYCGMAAIRIRGELSHDPVLVAASVAIGIGASIAALWLVRTAFIRATRLLGALVMGCAVAALHYTGMAGVHASLDPTATMPEGATLLDLMLPAYIFGTIILAAPLVALVLARQSADTEVDEAIATWSAEINDAVPYPGDRGQEATAELDTRRDVPRRPADPLRKGDVQVMPHERVR